jgi:hypothetical protein
MNCCCWLLTITWRRPDVSKFHGAAAGCAEVAAAVFVLPTCTASPIRPPLFPSAVNFSHADINIMTDSTSAFEFKNPSTFSRAENQGSQNHAENFQLVE